MSKDFSLRHSNSQPQDKRLQAANQVDRGAAAKRFLEEPLVEEFLERTKEQFIRQWAATPPEAKDLREELYSRVCALTALEEWLRQVINIGEKAKLALTASSESNAKETIE